MKKIIFLFIFCITSGMYASESKNKSFIPQSSKTVFQNDTAIAFGIGAGFNTFIHCSSKSTYTIPQCLGLGVVSGIATTTIIKAGLDQYNTTIMSDIVSEDNN